MAGTRSQISKNSQSESGNMEYCSDNQNDISISVCNSRGAANNIERASLLDLERDHERIRYCHSLEHVLGPGCNVDGKCSKPSTVFCSKTCQHIELMLW